MVDRKKQSSYACNLAQVLADESKCLKELRGNDDGLQLTPVSGAIPDRLGLAFSGGGIRSSCVNLGVLQELARVDILKDVDYVSAVSGGGYILGWLTAWIRRAGFAAVNEQLASARAKNPAETSKASTYERFLEPFPLRHLRDYAAYLTPRMGIFTGDTLSAVAIYLRNLLLNQVLLAAGAVAVLAALQCLSPQIFWRFAKHHFVGVGWVAACLFCVGLLLLYLESSRALILLQNGQKSTAEKSKEPKWQAWMAIAGGILTATALWIMTPGLLHLLETSLTATVVLSAMAALLALVCGLCLVAPKRELHPVNPKRELHPVNPKRELHPVNLRFRRFWLFFSVLAAGAFIGLCIYWMKLWLIHHGTVWIGDSYAILGLPAWLALMAMASFIQIGILGDAFPDAEREWLGRLFGYFLAAACIIGVGLAIALCGTLLMQFLFVHAGSHSTTSAVLRWVLPGGWFFTVVTGLLSAKSAKTGGHADAKSSHTLEIFASVAPPVFLIGVLLLLSWGTHSVVKKWWPTGEYLSVMQQVPPVPPASPAVLRVKRTKGMRSIELMLQLHSAAPSDSSKWVVAPDGFPLELCDGPQNASPWWLLPKIFAICATAFLLLQWRLDANEFSLHLFYRNRLVRAFLGASNSKHVSSKCDRRPNPFTKFAFDDDVELAKLVPARRESAGTEHSDVYEGPYPIWCGTLNLTQDTRLAAQQRKGDSFIYSPLYCGWDYVGEFPAESEGPACACTFSEKLCDYAYRPNAKPDGWTGQFEPYGGDSGNVYVGTAMAASGAAISPNWGFHTKPSIAALLAIFNVRIGCWMGNPRNQKGWNKYAPIASYLISELCGFANDKSKYIYISDGGHFENLGIYELVRRRVKFIIACDADADPEYEFSDLGNAVEKCRRDFGADIAMYRIPEIPPPSKKSLKNVHYAIGRIHYPERYAGDPQTEGLLLYIKSSLTGDEPSDIFSAKNVDTKFPHDTTFNQFFNETQFEAYRALGQHMLHAVWNDCCVPTPFSSSAAGSGTKPPRVKELYDFLSGELNALSAGTGQRPKHYQFRVDISKERSAD